MSGFLNFGSLAPGAPTNLYLRAWGDAATTLLATDADTYVVMPYAAVLRNLIVEPAVPGAGSDVLTCTVQVNGTDTALLVAHTESAASTSNTTDTVIVGLGDIVRVKVTGSGSISGSDYRVVVAADPIGTGALAVTLDDATLSATGTTVATATLAVTLDDATLAAVGFVPAEATLAVLLDDATLSAEAFTPFIAPPFDHVAEAVRRLAQHLRGEEPGNGLVNGRPPAEVVPPAPRFAIAEPPAEVADHATAAVRRLAEQFRFDA